MMMRQEAVKNSQKPTPTAKDLEEDTVNNGQETDDFNVHLEDDNHGAVPPETKQVNTAV